MSFPGPSLSEPLRTNVGQPRLQRHNTTTTGARATEAWAYPIRLWPGGRVVRMGCSRRTPVLSGPMPQRGPPAPQPNSTGLSTTRHGTPTSFWEEL